MHTKGFGINLNLESKKMHKPIVHSSWQFNIKELSKPIELYCDILSRTIKNPNALKVFWSNEPKEILPNVHQHLLHNHSFYDLIFTWDPILLNLGKANIKSYMMFHCWCAAYARECNGIFKKDFNVSTVVGDKMALPGHRLRNELWIKKDQITIPKNFYKSSKGNPLNGEAKVLGDTKYELFDSQFHIAIENINTANMYTEKINDCMITKTVPIYWGADDIGKVYNIKGIIQISSIDDLIKKVNAITPETYNNMKPYIEDNYQRALNLSKITLGDIIEKEL